MLSSLAGGDALEIVVSLKDLTSAGFAKVQGQMDALAASSQLVKDKTLALQLAQAKHAETLTKYGAESSQAAQSAVKLSKAENDLKKATEDATGGSGGGGLLGMISGLTGLPGPAAAAGAAIAGLAALGAATIPVYEKVEKQEKALATAATDHGIALDAMNKFVEDSITVGEQYAYSADDTRAAIAKLTEAGMSLADQQAALPHIMDLARAKNLDLGEAAKAYELALMGNARALKDLGIALPKVTDAEQQQQKAQEAVTKASTALTAAQDQLRALQDRIAPQTTLTIAQQLQLTKAHEAVTAAIDKHGASSQQARDAEMHLAAVEQTLTDKTHLSAAQHDRLQQAQDKVKNATATLQEAQDKLNSTQDAAAQKADRLKQLNDDLTGSVGNQRDSISALDKKQATLGDKWEAFATKIGPALEAVLGAIVDALSWIVDRLSSIADWFNHFDWNKFGNAVTSAQKSSGMTNSQFLAGLGKHAKGGWVGLNGPELSMVGEEGPEYIVPNDKLSSLAAPQTLHVHAHLYLDGQELAYSLERPLALALNNRGTGAMSFGGA